MVLPVFGRNRPEGKILETVGVFEAVKQHGKYETGQVRRRSTTHTIHILRQYWFFLLIDWLEVYLLIINQIHFHQFNNTFASFLNFGFISHHLFWSSKKMPLYFSHLWALQVAVIQSSLLLVDPPPADIISSHCYLLLCSPQLFLHSVFGYRGIVLFPWHARLYDRDVTPAVSDRWDSYLRRQTAPVGRSRFDQRPFLSLCCSQREPPGAHGSKEVKGKTHTYYQVLIDTRDCPHIVSYCLSTAKLLKKVSTTS